VKESFGFVPSKYSRLGVGIANNDTRLPKRPTRHGPGTVEKLMAMSRRAKRGESLFHERDETEFNGTRLDPMPKSRQCDHIESKFFVGDSDTEVDTAE